MEFISIGHSMKEFPVFKLKAVLKPDLPSVTRVIGNDEVEYYLWVEIPKELCRYYELYQFEKIDETIEQICILQFVEHASGPWYKIPTGILDLTPGQHVYCFRMVNKQNNQTMSFYFSYILQHDNPDKPYMYMNRGQKGSCACSGIKF